FSIITTLHPPPSTPFPYTTLFRSCKRHDGQTRTCSSHAGCSSTRHCAIPWSLQKSSAQTEQRDEHASQPQWSCRQITRADTTTRSEEHTSELQSRFDLVCRLLLEK